MLLDYLNNNYDEEDVNRIIDGIGKRITSIRINTLKSSKEEVLNVLNNNKIKYKEVSWYKDALIIESDIKLEELDIYKEGKIYLQSLSSMIPPIIIEPGNEQILDMTAAPGSKTSEIAQISNNTSMITAVEKNKKRYERLKYNLDKLGVKKCNIINKDARYLDDFYRFDKILIDAPCSGSGTLEDINKFDEELLNRINNIQKELVDKGISLLKSNGILIYSTCSILNIENEEIIDYILDKYDDMVLIDIDKDIFKDIDILPSKYKEVLKVLPSKEYEGFFVCKLKKK